MLSLSIARSRYHLCRPRIQIELGRTGGGTISRPSLSATGSTLTWALVALGVVLRLVHYLQTCSLSVDESLLALNILDRNWNELFVPLDGAQGAPILFLLALKAVSLTLGESEASLRLLALLAGVASMFLFRSLAIRTLSHSSATIAVAFFAFAGQLIFYSAQVKQYSGDVAIAIILLLVCTWLRKRDEGWFAPVLVGLLGAAAICSSHPALFVLGGIGLSILLFDLKGRPIRVQVRQSIAPCLWGMAAILNYILMTGELSRHEWLLRFWEGEFMPFPPTSLSDVRWFVTAYFQIFTKTLGFSLWGVCGLVALVGGYALWKSDRRLLTTLVTPLLLALAASGLRMYPFCCRLLLFAAPALLLLMAHGTSTLLRMIRPRSFAGVSLLVFLFIHPVMWAGFHLVTPRHEEEIKPALEYMQQHRRDGDTVYIYYGAEPAFTYYARRYDLDVRDCCTVGVRSRKLWSGYREDLESLQGRSRVWCVFSHVYDWKHVDERVLFLNYLDEIGTQRQAFEAHGAAVYLYDLTERPSGIKPSPHESRPAPRSAP